MRVKHGTQVRFTVTSGGEVLEESTIPIENLGGAVTRVSIMYNSLTMSGGTRWAHPATGYALKTPKWSFELVDPSDELTGDQLCDCDTCERKV